MSVNRGALISFLLLLVFSAASASKIDSLFNRLEVAKADSIKLRYYIEISQEFSQSNPDSAIEWLNKVLRFRPSQHNLNRYPVYNYFYGEAHVSLSTIYYVSKRDFEVSQNHADSGNVLLSKLNDLEVETWLLRKKNISLSRANNILARISLSYGDLNQAIEYFSNAKNQLVTFDDRSGTAKMKNNLGVLHRRQSNYAKSIQFFQ